MSDKFVMSARQAAELDYGFERHGWTPQDVKWLSSGSVLADLLKVRRGHASIAVIEHVIDCDAQPFVPDGWTVEKHQKGGAFKWDKYSQKNARYFSDGCRNGRAINGNELLEDLAGGSVLNANALDYLLENPHCIPEGWEDEYVCFPGTEYLDSDGNLCVRILYKGSASWKWASLRLDRYWPDSHTVALRAS